MRFVYKHSPVWFFNIETVFVTYKFLLFSERLTSSLRMHVFKCGILLFLVAEISFGVSVVKREAPLPSGGYLPPSTSYGVPDLSTNFISPPSSSYGAPNAQAPSSQYGAPSQGNGHGGHHDASHSSNGNSLGGGYPSAPSSSYGAPSGGNGGGYSSGPAQRPSSQYGPPSQGGNGFSSQSSHSSHSGNGFGASSSFGSNG